MPRVILGLMSDTHGRSAAARAAVAKLLGLGAEYVIHCGDVGDNVVPLLPAGRSAFVLGNNDWNTAELAAEAGPCEVLDLGFGGTLAVGGVTVAVTHGDDTRRLRSLLGTPGVRYLFTGHSHVPHDRRESGVRWINPGALHRANPKTVATLDLATDELTLYEIG